MSATVLEVQDLAKYFPIRKGFLRRQVGAVRAVDGVSFAISRGETLALVGESGCGKTTVSRCILRAMAPSAGAIRFTVDGRTHDLAALPRRAIRPLRRHMQMVFQDPYASLNPRMVVADLIGEPLLLNGWNDREARRRRIAELLDLVQLPVSYMDRYPHAFSGGQRQRIGIARALALNPSLIVADEPVSALDVSVQAQIVNLILDLQDRLKLSLLFVAHDLSVVKHVADRVAVMYLGRIVEMAGTAALYARPLHPYTRSLLSAVPHPDPRTRQKRVVLQGSVPDAAHPPPGCHFHPRCAHATERCRTEAPALRSVGAGVVACHHAEELAG
ncbi:ABC transporter ATP-binding protein [Falsiroseomonas sp. HW251]|uniref:ABC transporter ATP-binding protein n=1 Tax=Falsiroseomonas sp. HW251 TaxID=3390998 RepID=UPI003D320756